MPRDSSGNYTLPAGNPVVGGTVISTAWANPTMADIAAALSDSLSRSGSGGMLAPFRFADGSSVTPPGPGISWSSEPAMGFYRFGANDMRLSITGVDRMKWTATDVSVWDTGTSAWLPLTGPGGSNFALINSPNVFTAASTNTFNAATTFNNGITQTGSVASTSSAPWTWSGAHSFSNTTGNGAVRLISATPSIAWNESTAAADAKAWRMRLGSGALSWEIMNDANSATSLIMRATRNVMAITALTFGNATDNPTFTFLGNGASTFAGTIITTGGMYNSGSAPSYRWNEVDQVVDERRWRAIIDAKQWRLETINDAESAFGRALLVNRGTGTAITTLDFGNATDNPTFNFLGNGITSFSGGATFSAGYAGRYGVLLSSADPGIEFYETDGAVDNRLWRQYADTNFFAFDIVNDARTATSKWLRVDRGGTTVSTVNFPNGILQYGGTEVGYRQLVHRDLNVAGSVADTDRGTMIRLGGSGGYTLTIPNGLTVDSIVTLVNVSAAPITISHAGSLLWLNGSGATAPSGNRTLAVSGVATLHMVTSGAAYIWGTGVS